MSLPRAPVKHRERCECAECLARRRVRRQITFAESLTLARLAARQKRAAEPVEVKPVRGREARLLRTSELIAAEVADTDRALEQQRQERERAVADGRAVRLAELRAAGVPMARCFEIIESEGDENGPEENS